MYRHLKFVLTLPKIAIKRMICFDHLPVLGVTQGHLGGPADAVAAVDSPFNKPPTTGGGGSTT